ncbi:hypothetical protein SLA2020_153200 [Shorea laevis]
MDFFGSDFELELQWNSRNKTHHDFLWVEAMPAQCQVVNNTILGYGPNGLMSIMDSQFLGGMQTLRTLLYGRLPTTTSLSAQAPQSLTGN